MAEPLDPKDLVTLEELALSNMGLHRENRFFSYSPVS